MRALTFALLAFAIVLTISTSANGDLIGLTDGPPDIHSSFLYVNYTYNGVGVDNDLTIDGSAINIVRFEGDIQHDIEHPTESGSPGVYELDAKIDDLGNLVSGTLSITGCIPDPNLVGYDSGTILTGDLLPGNDDNNFGHSAASDLLEFKFVVTGGDAVECFGDGSIGGIILHLASDEFAFNNDFADNFETHWDNDEMYDGSGFNSSAQADNFFEEVPEPATLGLMAFGLGLIARKRRS